jgi:hypothetical protein
VRALAHLAFERNLLHRISMGHLIQRGLMAA